VSAHPLDRPVWSALTTGWGAIALGDERALRLAPAYGPFAAAADDRPASQAALIAFDPGEAGLWLLEPEPAAAPEGLAVAVHAPVLQMIAPSITAGEPDFEVALLGEEDAPQMRALAELTRPGPFSMRTHRLGGFIGVKQDGRLVAMAGERMRMDGFAEVSGVCTHPDHRGRGYAGGLMRLVARRILARGETPFLHTYESNATAIALYRTLGFEARRTVVLTVLKRS
jgi:predicted GNAT family acetyltransferase